MKQLTGYRIFVVNGKKAASLADDSDTFSMEEGETEEREDGFLVGVVNKDCYWYIDNPDHEKQVMIEYKFDPKDIIDKQTEDGEVRVRKAKINKVTDLESSDKDAELEESIKPVQMPVQDVFEAMTYDQLLRISEPKRILRARTVRGPSLDVEAAEGSLFFHFNFKSYPSTTGLRHRGYVKFLKPEGLISPNDARPLEHVDAYADCTCPDYRYRWAWANKQKGAGGVGVGTLNLCLNRAPRITNPMGRPGLCKHLLALGDYVYGQSSTFPGTGVATKLGKVQRFANKRWANIGAEIATAKERAKKIKGTIDKARRGAEREVVPDAPPPEDWAVRIDTMPVPEPPKIGEPVPETPAAPDTKVEKPSFLQRLTTAAKTAGEEVAKMTTAAQKAEKSLLGEPDAEEPKPKTPKAKAKAEKAKEKEKEAEKKWIAYTNLNASQQDRPVDGVCNKETKIMDLHEAEEMIKDMKKTEIEAAPAPAPIGSEGIEGATETDPGSQVISLLSQILQQITLLNQEEAEEEEMEVEVPSEEDELEGAETPPAEGEVGPPKLTKD